MKRILITGANGFVGSYLTQYLQEQGYSVTAMVRNSANCKLLFPHIQQIKTDYSQEDLNTAFSGQDIIIHCAALVRARNWNEYYQANVELTKKVMYAYQLNETNSQLVMLSSQAAAGMAAPCQAKKETDPCNPITDYGRSKRIAEHLLIDGCLKPWTIIRPASVYGPGDKDFLSFFQAIQKHLSVNLGKPDKRISFVYVRELADLISKVLEAKASHYQIFFASDGKTYNQSDFVDALHKVIPTWTLQLQLPDSLLIPIAALSEMGGFLTKKAPVLNWQKKDEITGKNWVVSNEKAKSLLGFKPKPNMVNNLKETYEWYQDKGWL